VNKPLATFLILLSAAAAWAAPGLVQDRDGGLYQYQLNGRTVEISGPNNDVRHAIYTFTAEVNSFQLAIDDNVYALSFETSEEVYFTSSADRGLNWDKPILVTVTGETVTQPRLAFDNLRTPQLIFLSFNQGLNRHRLYYTALAPIEPRMIFESQDDIVNPRIAQTSEALLINWQTDYLGRQTTYVSVSLDQGEHFGAVRSLAPPLAAPKLIAPRNGYLTNFSSPEVHFIANSADPVITKVELSWEKSFPPDKTWSFEYFSLPGSPETDVRLPLNLPDGQYFLRLTSRDGLSASPTAGPVSFKIDTTAPLVTLASPSAEASDDDQVTFAGTVSEPASLCLNGQPLSTAADGRFSCLVPLRSGLNSFELLATDEAGNVSRLTRTVSYAATVPHLKILRPRGSDWFKPGSAVYFEAEIGDSQNNIDDETEGSISVNSRVLPDKPVYDQSSKKLSGFINLPPQLSDGPLTATARLNDRSGNAGQKDFPLNIDNTPPVRVTGIGEAVYTKSAWTIPLPVNDNGSGLDLQGTMVKINGISLEAVLTVEANPSARLNLPLADGSYEVIVLPRDNVGNTAEAINYQLIVDTVPPVLSVYADTGTEPKTTPLLISGEVSGNYLAGLNFYNGQNLAGSLNAPAGRFTYNLPLVNGRNNIRVEAVDRAGNKTSCSLSVNARVASAGLINKFAAAPCPFSPKTDKTVSFVFSFSAAPDRLKLYVFDLAGTLLWRRDLANFTGTALAWDGVDSFGRPVGNGVYPYLASVTVGGQTEIKKGKLIVLQ
jgi:hypothetical protein